MVVNFNKILNETNNEQNVNNLMRQFNTRSQASNASDNSLVRNLELSTNLFKEDAYEKNSRIKNATIKVTKPSLVMYNVTVKNNEPIGLTALAQRIKGPFEKHVFENNGITIQVVKVTGYVGRFQPAFTINNTYARKNLVPNTGRIFAIDFYIKVTLGPEIVNATLTLFKNGTMKLSGGYLSQNKENVDNDFYFEAQPEMIREYIVNTYTDGQQFLRKKFTFNNVVGEFRVNKGFNLATIIAMARGSNYNIGYEPELSHLLKFKSDGYNFTFSQNGLIQIRGLKEQDALDKAYVVGLKFINDMTAFHKAHPRMGLLYKDRTLPAVRRKKQHVLNTNAPAPNITRRGTTCPMKRRPSPYSMQGQCPKEGCYVKPNPQGQPCCYKVPKNTSYSEKRVQNAFAKANVRVPSKVRRVFNFGNNTNNKRNNTSHGPINVRVKFNDKLGLKIGTRQCSRYTKVALVDIARRLGLAVKPEMTKPVLCELIGSRATNVTNMYTTFKNGNRTYEVSGSTVANLRIGERFARTYKRDVLLRFARALHLGVPEGATIAQICAAIASAAGTRSRPASASSRSSSSSRTSPSSSSSSSSSSSRTSSSNSRSSSSSSSRSSSSSSSSPSSMTNAQALNIALTQLRLTEPLIKEDIRKLYGANVPNFDRRAKEVYKIIEASFSRNIGYGKVPMGKSGMPLRSGIQKMKETIVKSWKNAENWHAGENWTPYKKSPNVRKNNLGQIRAHLANKNAEEL